MEKYKKLINITAIIFAVCFLIVTILRWSSIETIDRIFYCVAVFGLGLLGLAPLFEKKK